MFRNLLCDLLCLVYRCEHHHRNNNDTRTSDNLNWMSVSNVKSCHHPLSLIFCQSCWEKYASHPFDSGFVFCCICAGLSSVARDTDNWRLLFRYCYFANQNLIFFSYSFYFHFQWTQQPSCLSDCWNRQSRGLLDCLCWFRLHLLQYHLPGNI